MFKLEIDDAAVDGIQVLFSGSSGADCPNVAAKFINNFEDSHSIILKIQNVS